MKIDTSINKVTSLSKILAATIFITLPFVAFYLGMLYQQYLSNLDQAL